MSQGIQKQSENALRRAFSVDIDNITERADGGIGMGTEEMGLLKSEADALFAHTTDKHAEIIAGELIIQDKTTPRHNEVVGEIYLSLKSFIKSKKGNCKVYAENVALYVGEIKDASDNDLYLPDVMVVCDIDGVKEDGVHSVPKLVVEVASLSTRRYDYNEKRETYRKIGVEEYWIIDIQRHLAIQHLSKDDFVPTFKQENEIEISSYPGLKIEIAM